jgi:hypothetical protein
MPVNWTVLRNKAPYWYAMTAAVDIGRFLIRDWFVTDSWLIHDWCVTDS